MIYDFAKILTGLIETMALFKVYDTFCERKEGVSSLGYFIGVMVFTVLINISNVIFSYGILNAVGMLAVFLLASIFYNGKISVKITLSILTLLFIAIIEIIVLFGMVFILKINTTLVVDNKIYNLLGIIISKTLTLFFAVVLNVKFKKKYLNVKTSYWWLFLIMFFTSVVNVFLIFKLSYDVGNSYMNNLSILCSFGLLFSTFFALYLYERLAKQNELIKEKEQYEQHLKMQLKHFDDILITQKQLKKFKHDFNNYTIGLQAYINKKDFNGATLYLESLKNEFENRTDSVDTGNVAFDSILTTKIAIAKSKNINVGTSIQLPERIDIDPIDICTVFGNALDNAIEACEKVSVGERTIDVSVIFNGVAVLCKIVNTKSAEQKEICLTSKEDKDNHGFGLENIKNTLEKYNSVPTIKITDTEFELKFMIFLKN